MANRGGVISNEIFDGDDLVAVMRLCGNYGSTYQSNSRRLHILKLSSTRKVGRRREMHVGCWEMQNFCLASESEPVAVVAHSITSVARIITDEGTLMPSALAVLRLIAKSNSVGCRSGKSAGFAPRNSLSI